MGFEREIKIPKRAKKQDEINLQPSRPAEHSPVKNQSIQNDSSKVFHGVVVGHKKTQAGKLTRWEIEIKEIGLVEISKKSKLKGHPLPMNAEIELIIDEKKGWRVTKILSVDGMPFKQKGVYPGIDKRFSNPNFIKEKDKKSFLSNWEEKSFVKLSDCTESHTIIPNHPERKFKGKIVNLNFIVGWQGYIYCEQINSLVYVKHTKHRKSGSIALRAKVEFYLGTSIDNRGDLQFHATDWESSVNRGESPEPALSFEFEEFKQSKELVNDILSHDEQFILITSYNNKTKAKVNKVYSAEQIQTYLNKHYSKYPIQVLDWPKFKPDTSNSASGRFSHPMIKNFLSAAVVIFPIPNGGEEE